MTKDSVLYCIAFAKGPGHTVYREQAKLMLESLVGIGRWEGAVVVFTNLSNRLLRDELSPALRMLVTEIPVPFHDFGSGKDGKLPAARFRIHAWKHFDDWRFADRVFYMDTDCIVRGRMDRVMRDFAVSQADIAGASVANRNMANSKWFHGHITPQFQASARRRPPVQSGTIAFRGGESFRKVCERWAEIDAWPARPGVDHMVVTDQSSHNLLHLLHSDGSNGLLSARLGVSSVACPHHGQRATLGHKAVNDAAIWHYWHLQSQEDRVVAMSSELDRLRRPSHPAPPVLFGTWAHTKPKESISNHWTFHVDGLVTVDNPAICGRWECVDGQVTVDWLWGHEVFTIPRCPAPSIIYGRSFRNGEFTLEKVCTS